MGVPDPLKDLPSISILIGIFKTSPVNSQCVCKLSIPDVPSKIYVQSMRGRVSPYLDNSSLSCNFENLTLSHGSVSKSYIYNLGIPIRQRRIRIQEAKRWDPYLGNLTLSRTTRGPSTSRTVLQSTLGVMLQLVVTALTWASVIFFGSFCEVDKISSLL